MIIFTVQSKCTPNPCLNDGTCRDVDVGRGYVCYCSIAHLGPNCESEFLGIRQCCLDHNLQNKTESHDTFHSTEGLLTLNFNCDGGF